MKLTMYFTILISCYITTVSPRSLQADKDILQYLRIGTPKEVTTSEHIDHVIWRILEQPPELNVQEKNENVKGDLENNSIQTTLLPEVSQNEVKDGEKGKIENDEPIDEISSVMESTQVSDKDKEVTMKSEDDQTEKSDKLVSQEILTERIPDAEMSESELRFDLNNTDALSSILNITGDAILLQSLADNSSLIDSHDYDEASLLSDGSEIALFQEVSTVGFELMIDSETKKNLLLAQMLSTEVLTEDEDGTLLSHFTPDEDSFSIANIHVSVNVEKNDKPKTNVTFHADDENKLDLSNSANSSSKESASEDVTGADLVSVQTERPKCPEPGWCLMFFLAQDACEKDSHCHGSRICCKWRCSMTCIDVDNLDT